MLATTTRTLWYFSRGTGVVSLVLLTASVALGVSEVARYASPGWPRFVVAALHRNVSLVATVLVAAHIETAVVDSFASIRLVDIFVPFVGSYRPIWLGLGAIATDLLVVLMVTSLLREQFGYRAWRAVHWTAYICWPIAFVHALGTGTDTRYNWAVAVNVGCLLVVLAAALFRVGWTRTISAASRATAAIASIAIAGSVVVWMVIEPMRSGWARKAGTPSALLATARATDPRGTTLPIPFSSRVQGSITETAGEHASIAINAVLPGAHDALLRIVIHTTPVSGGGVRMKSGTVDLGVADAPDLYHGRVTNFEGIGSITATARPHEGSQISLSMRFELTDTNAVGGSVSARLGGSDGS